MTQLTFVDSDSRGRVRVGVAGVGHIPVRVAQAFGRSRVLVDSASLTGGSGGVTVQATRRGLPGASAYQLAVTAGFQGSEEDWLASLKGDPGVHVGPTPPPSPAVGDVWVDTSG